MLLQVTDSHKAQFERELLLKGEILSDEEHKRLLAKFKQEQEAIERNLESERQRQNNSLADKVIYSGGVYCELVGKSVLKAVC